MANITKPIGLSNIWANGGTKVDPGASKVNIGWVVQLPPYEYQNWVDNRQDQAIAHISQHGIPEWDALTEYQGLLSYTQGSDGLIYKCLQTNTNKDPANALNSLYWTLAFESYGSVAVVQSALVAHITNYQTLAGIGNIAGARANLSVYSKLESDTRFASLNGNSSQVFAVGVATQPEHAVRLGQVASLLNQATEASSGVVQIATMAEVEAGVSDSKVVTPLKGATVYLKRTANLAGLPNVPQARLNLGLGTMATEASGSFLRAANNLGDITNQGQARTNLGLTSTATQPENYFLRAAYNLADLPNPAAARNSLGLESTATTPLASLMVKSDNLAGLTNVAQARANLGLGNIVGYNIGDVLQRNNNLGDLANAQSARNNLGLGSAATMNAYGVVGSLNFTSQIGAQSGFMSFPNGVKMAYGTFSVGAARAASVYVSFSTQFSTIFNINITPANAATDQLGYNSVTGNGMYVQKGTGDPAAREGMWQVWGV